VYEADVTEDTVEDDAVQQPRAKAQPDLLLVAALSKEPRLGRWSRVAGDGTKNGTLIVKLVRGESALE
jgi:ribosomal RNA-processing protein 9